MARLPLGSGDASSLATLGLLLMLVSTALLAGMHGIVRHLGTELHPFVIVFFRNLFGLIAVLPLIVRGGRGIMHTARPRLMLVRGAISITAMLSWFYALSVVPIATATALSFTTALWAAVFAALLLGERMRLRRWAAIGAGMIGVLVILRPGLQSLDWGMLIVLFSAVFWGVAINIVKLLGRTDSPTSIVAWLGIMLSVLSLPPALLYWQWPNTEQLLALALCGALASLGHLCMARSLKLADTTAVMAIDFARLPWTAAIGVVFFGDHLDIWTWVGAAIIFAAGIYVIWRENRADAR